MKENWKSKLLTPSNKLASLFFPILHLTYLYPPMFVISGKLLQDGRSWFWDYWDIEIIGIQSGLLLYGLASQQVSPSTLHHSSTSIMHPRSSDPSKPVIYQYRGCHFASQWVHCTWCEGPWWPPVVWTSFWTQGLLGKRWPQWTRLSPLAWQNESNFWMRSS